MKNIKLIVALFSCLIVLSSCKKDAESSAEMEVYLQDAPASGLEKIKIHVKGVSIYSQASGSWVSLTVNNGLFDLLTLDSTNQAFLGKIKLKGGTIDQLQLVIGSDNSVVVNGISHPLVLDASDLDKLKVKINYKLNGGSFYKLTIDFKASESIDENGGVYKLKASLKISVKQV